MKFASWITVPVVALGLACGGEKAEQSRSEPDHGGAPEKAEAKFAWGPAAPEPPIMPSPVPQLPEQTGSPKNPGNVNGPDMEDKLIPSTANPAMPK